MKLSLTILFFCVSLFGTTQTISKVWVADNGDGTFKNPIIHADYSDPDAIRVGNDFYMISSSFNHVPGLPILHSKDLVNWQLLGHALKKLPAPHFDTVQHGGGVWAPSIRYHNNEFFIYYPDPDFGIYLIKSKNINGPWTEPLLIQSGKGLIDPCPLWDDDGKVYLVHAYAGSRAGFKSIIVVKELNASGTKVIGDAVMVYDGHHDDPTIEGPKFYKRKGWYYIFAPAGGVSTGWQTVLRSKNVYGPYERKVVMDQGRTKINGPHQGAWVTTQTGEDWFLHFQDKDEFGRVVHLQPMKWVNDWPVIGEDIDGDGKGEPVTTYNKPNVGKSYPRLTPADSDEFNEKKMGLQWQWQANQQEGWAFPASDGTLRMYALYHTDHNLWNAPFILAQKLPSTNFYATVKFRFHPKLYNDKFGLVLFGRSYFYISVTKKDDGNYISFTTGLNSDKDSAEVTDNISKKVEGDLIYLRLAMVENQVGIFYYSTNGVDFYQLGSYVAATPGKWVGAKLGLFFTRNDITNDAGYVDIDWFRIEADQYIRQK